MAAGYSARVRSRHVTDTAVAGSGGWSRWRETWAANRDLLPLFIDQRKAPSPMDKAHVEALGQKHAAIQARIDDEEHRPHPDDTVLHSLKKAKLKVKDVMLGH
jgi:hypothetical protein